MKSLKANNKQNQGILKTKKQFKFVEFFDKVCFSFAVLGMVSLPILGILCGLSAGKEIRNIESTPEYAIYQQEEMEKLDASLKNGEISEHIYEIEKNNINVSGFLNDDSGMQFNNNLGNSLYYFVPPVALFGMATGTVAVKKAFERKDKVKSKKINLENDDMASKEI